MKRVITSLGRATLASGLAAAIASRGDPEGHLAPGRVRSIAERDAGCYPETAADPGDGCFPDQGSPGAGCFPGSASTRGRPAKLTR